MSRPVTPAELLEQEDFLRGLVRGLLVDEHEVDDVVQQTWLQALTRPPSSPGRLRGWLVIVARNLARRRRRAEGRRERREAAAARLESLPPTDAIVERLELQRVLVEAVLALEEPYRTTVLLRFFDGLPVKELARRMSVPVATVHTRLRRALDQLRGRLDREREGDRRAWCLALLPIATGRRSLAMTTAAGTSTGMMGMLAMTMQTKWVVAALALAIGATAWWIWPEGEETGVLDVAVVDEQQQTLDPLEPRATKLETALEETLPPASESADAPSPASSRTGDLIVEAVWEPNGSPAAGLWMELGPFDTARSGPMLRTDEDGRARFTALEPGPVTVRPLRGGKVVSGQVAAGEASKLRVIIPRGIDVLGTVVDVKGEPIANAEIRLGHSSVRQAAVVTRSAEDGAFSLASVQDRSVFAWSAGYRLSKPERISGSPGTRQRVRLVLEGPAGRLSGRLLEVGGDPVGGATVSCGFTDLHVTSDADGRFFASGLQPFERHPVNVYTSRGHWRFPVAVRANETTEVEWYLDPAETAALRGVVRWADGEPVTEVGIQVGGSSDRRAVRTQTDLEGRFELIGLLPGETRASVEVFDWPAESVELVAGRVTEWNPVLKTEGASDGIEGRVVDFRGGPLRGWNVELRHENRSWLVETDEEGRFGLRGAPDQEYVIGASPPGLDLEPPSAVRRGHRPGDGFVLLKVPDGALPTSHIEGRLHAEDPALLRSTDVSVAHHANELGGPEYATILEGGAFRVGPLPPGRYTLLHRSPGGSSVEHGVYDLEPNETLDVGVVDVDLPGSIAGRLRAADGSELALRRTFAETDGRNGFGLSVEAAIEGRSFEIGPLEAGEWQLWAFADGYPTIDLGSHTLETGQRLDLGTIPVARPGRLTVRSERGGPRDPGIQVEVFARGLRLAKHALPGDWSLPLWPGSYRVIAHGSWMADRQHDIRVVAGETTTVVIEHEPAVGCLLVFTDASSGHTRRGHVSVREQGGDRVLLDTPFEIAGDLLPQFGMEAPSGAWEIEWTTPEDEQAGMFSTSGRRLPSGEPSTGSLSVEIVDSTGSVPRTGRVSNDGKRAPTWFVRLAPGSYRVVIDDRGEKVERTFRVEEGNDDRRRLIEIPYR